MAGFSALRTLLVMAGYTDRLSYFDDWRDAFCADPAYDCTVADIRRPAGRRLLSRAAPGADVIVALHSTNGDSIADLSRCRAALDRRRGPLVAFVGNELNLPAVPLAPKLALLADLGAEIVATQLLQEAGEWLYGGRTSAKVVSLPHALNPEAFRPEVPDGRRPVDIGVRSWRYLAVLGDDDRNRLFDAVARNAFDPPLVLDLSTTERLSRPEWARFLNRCKGTISTEAGSFHLEPDDATVGRIQAWLRSREQGPGWTLAPGPALRRLARLVPAAARARLRARLAGGPVRLESARHEALTFAEVEARFFRDRAPAPVYTKCISSRHFDAAGTRTCQVMGRGRFNDILEADRHYLAVERDLSNLDEVVERFRDPAERDRVTAAAHEHVLDGHTYRHRTRALRALLG